MSIFENIVRLISHIIWIKVAHTPWADVTMASHQHFISEVSYILRGILSPKRYFKSSFSKCSKMQIRKEGVEEHELDPVQRSLCRRVWAGDEFLPNFILGIENSSYKNRSKLWIHQFLCIATSPTQSIIVSLVNKSSMNVIITGIKSERVCTTDNKQPLECLCR